LQLAQLATQRNGRPRYALQQNEGGTEQNKKGSMEAQTYTK